MARDPAQHQADALGARDLVGIVGAPAVCEQLLHPNTLAERGAEARQLCRRRRAGEQSGQDEAVALLDALGVFDLGLPRQQRGPAYRAQVGSQRVDGWVLRGAGLRGVGVPEQHHVGLAHEAVSLVRSIPYTKTPGAVPVGPSAQPSITCTAMARAALAG
ncbi:MAG TPA: hypothetical protein VKE22_02230 [Haliangiales bacterium]|nr:hypothetical protein [Haliangiales bacterium]